LSLIYPTADRSIQMNHCRRGMSIIKLDRADP
jgi:hypothetical protein